MDAVHQGILHLAQGSHTKHDGLHVRDIPHTHTEYVATGEAQACSKYVKDWLQGQRQLRGHAPNAAVPGNSVALGSQRGPGHSRVWSGCTETKAQVSRCPCQHGPKSPPREATENLATNGNEHIPNTPCLGPIEMEVF